MSDPINIELSAEQIKAAIEDGLVELLPARVGCRIIVDTLDLSKWKITAHYEPRAPDFIVCCHCGWKAVQPESHDHQATLAILLHWYEQHQAKCELWPR